MAGSGSGITTELERILGSDAWGDAFERRELSDEVVMHIEPRDDQNVVVALCLIKMMSPEFLDIVGIDPADKSDGEDYIIGTVTDNWNPVWHHGKSYSDLVIDKSIDEDRIAFIRHDEEDHGLVWERKGVEYAEVGIMAKDTAVVTERIIPFIPEGLRTAANLAINEVINE